MKKLLTLALVLFGTSSFAETFRLSTDAEAKCPGVEIEGSELFWTQAKYFNQVLKAKVGGPYKGPGLEVISENDLDVIHDLGIMPDADTNGIYSYVRYLRDSSNKHVGYMLIEGFENYEMGVRLQVTKRLNILGEVIKVSVTDK